jgi:hypothetical protein
MGTGTVVMPDRQFEPGLIPFNQIGDAQLDRMYVDTGIILDELTDHAPWFFSVLYNDGAAISIPLELMFYEGLKGATATLYRRHKRSGRIIPCQISQDDPGFKNPTDASMSWQDVLLRVVPPRFDPVLTPNIINFLNQEQMISLSLGILKVINLQLYNPVLFGWSASAVAESTAGKTVLSAIARRAAITVDATTLGERLATEVAGLDAKALQKFLEAVRRLGMTRGVPPQVKADAIEVIARELGLDVGGQSMGAGGKILVAAKDGRTALQVAADGSITFGKATIVGLKLQIVNPIPIRPFVP